MDDDESLPRLREIRDHHRRDEKMQRERTREIKTALANGHSVRRVSQAIGLSPTRVLELARKSE